MSIFTTRKRSLGQGDVLHMYVSHSVHRRGLYPSMKLGRGSISACNWAGVCVSQHAIGQECVYPSMQLGGGVKGRWDGEILQWASGVNCWL